MSFFENLFHKKEKGESIIVIDIGAEGISGAYVRYEGDEPPTLLYLRRLPIEIRGDEAHDRAMLRALKMLGEDLVREGAPVLARVTGSGTATDILVSVDAPWQETVVHTENFEAAEPFVFTKALVDKKLAETAIAPTEKLLADESIIGTILNGYETHDPYGKKVHRASIVVLTSLINKAVADDINATLRGLFHTTRIQPIAGNSLRYQALRALFPHEDDALILDATGGPLLSVALIRKGVFNTLIQAAVPKGADAWTATVTSELSLIAKHYPLPRTIFLLAREQEAAALQEKLETADFGSLWLSDNPPKMISITKNHLNGLVRQLTEIPSDIVILLMALYWRHREK